MKKLLGIILVSLLCFNISIADENKELKLIQDYKEKLLEKRYFLKEKNEATSFFLERLKKVVNEDI